MRVAVCTNVYNEDFNLPIWIRHYEREFGRGSCFVIDHGSDYDVSRKHEGVNVFRVPRSPFDDAARSRAISAVMNGLLEYHDIVIYTDSDELLVADPRKYSSLSELLYKTDSECYTAVGIDVIQTSDEPSYDHAMLVSEQRRHGVFNRAMFKTCITRKMINWGGGFHSSSLPPNISGLFLFHLKMMDEKSSLMRLALTRKMQWCAEGFGMHQRVEDEKLLATFSRHRSKSVCIEFFDRADAESKMQAESVKFNIWNQTYRLDAHILCDDMMFIDQAFVGKF